MLIVEPADELILEGPFNRAVCKKIMVFNPSKQKRVAFKLKTTTPRLFFVRPNVGLVQPEEKIAIDIFVHPVSNDIYAHRHKFMMQAADASDPICDLHEFWKNISPSTIWDTKLKVKLIDSQVEGVQKSYSDKIQNISEHQDKDNLDPLTNLLEQVNVLEEDRQHLMQQVETITKEKDEQRELLDIKLQKQKGSGFWIFVATVAMLLAAIVGGWVAKKFM
ncbi:vesicle-associated membrane protein/synaptobrevin-binding protein [Drosophila hydei]|uniref:Vesicle-associated membrane protein/synaptobrevin-binding protein n=1 Tax=Drosophila hydei TaxID=7224 RepID=A0A6J1M5D7_DROHY|nr:vesicle-associated membrane protein/synaptobrevin-binding protein [Drosophila hydei]